MKISAAKPGISLAIACFSALLGSMNASAAEPQSARSTAVLGGGCFWCVEAVFERIEGVESVESGYAGGEKPDPTYEEVCSGRSGHAEVVRVTFDPAKVSYRKIIDTFWKAHDPTTPNRQGADEGPQYRSIILYADAEQKSEAEAAKAAAQADFKSPIVTEISPLTAFYAAEGYHQDYYDRNRNAPYCRAVIAPKLKKLGME